MKFVVAIEPASPNTAWGAAVPDLPGCFSAGDSIDDVLDNVKDAIDHHVEVLMEDGVSLPDPQPLSLHQKNRDYKGWIWAVVEVPVEKYFGPAEKINITVPKLILARIDDYARSHGLSRSGFLVEAARHVMTRQR